MDKHVVEHLLRGMKVIYCRRPEMPTSEARLRILVSGEMAEDYFPVLLETFFQPSGNGLYSFKPDHLKTYRELASQYWEQFSKGTRNLLSHYWQSVDPKLYRQVQEYLNRSDEELLKVLHEYSEVRSRLQELEEKLCRFRGELKKLRQDFQVLREKATVAYGILLVKGKLTSKKVVYEGVPYIQLESEGKLKARITETKIRKVELAAADIFSCPVEAEKHLETAKHYGFFWEKYFPIIDEKGREIRVFLPTHRGWAYISTGCPNLVLKPLKDPDFCPECHYRSGSTCRMTSKILKLPRGKLREWLREILSHRAPGIRAPTYGKVEVLDVDEEELLLAFTMGKISWQTFEKLFRTVQGES